MLKRDLFKILKEIGLVDNGTNQFAVYKVEGIDQYKISDNKCNEYKGDFKRLTELIEDKILMSLLNIEVRINEGYAKGSLYKYKTWRVSFHTKNLGYEF